MSSAAYIGAVIVAGILFSLSELSVILSPASNCYMGRKDTLRLLIMLLVCAGVLLSAPMPFGDRPFEAGLHSRDFSAADFAVVAVSVAAAFGLGRVLTRWPAFVLALAGALSGHLLLRDGASPSLWGLPLAWIVAALAAMLLAAGISPLIRYLSNRSKRHYLLRMWTVGNISTAVAALMLLAAGLNAGSLFKPGGMPGFSRETLLIALIAVCFLSRPVVRRALYPLNESAFDVSPESSLSIMIAVTLTSFVFSSGAVASLFGCAATPLSPSILAFSALAGCGIGRNNAVMERSEQFRTAVAAVAVPAAGFIFAYFASALLHPSAIDTSSAVFLSLVIAASVLAVLVLSAVIVRFFLSYRRSARALTEAEDCLNENRRAVNVMELKTMRLENEYLRNHLELQHREVMNIAMSISEQKEFIEKIYGMVRDAETEQDPEKKAEALHGVSTELSLRMNFSSEIDGFYTQVEQLHKDFTVRLQEKYPNLTKQERRLTTLLRLGFSSKYIAVLMNISPKSVEICRHRLRTKLGLGRKESLTGFVKSI